MINFESNQHEWPREVVTTFGEPPSPRAAPSVYLEEDPNAPAAAAASRRDWELLVGRVVMIGTLFLFMVFSVFREIHYNRELYRMSRMVTASETQARLWHQQLRIEEAREARMEAASSVQPGIVLNPALTSYEPAD